MTAMTLVSPVLSPLTPSRVSTAIARRYVRWMTLLLVVTVCLSFIPDLAHAAEGGNAGSFALDKILPASMIEKPFLVKVITVLVMMAIAGGVVMLGFGVMGGVGDVFTAVSDARRHGEWGVFIKNVAFIIAVLVVAAVLIALVMEWMNNLTINPTISIG